MKIEIRKDQKLLNSVMEKTGLSSEFILKIADEFDICANADRDPIPIILSAMQSERYLKYKSEATKQSVVRSALCRTSNAELEGDPFDETVMVFGGTDRSGKDPKKNPPMYYIALKKNKELIRIKSWDTELFSVLPCKARVVGTFTTNAQWGDAVVPEEDGVLDVEEVDSSAVQKALMRVAMTPAMCGSVGSDLVRYNAPYAITGKIQWVNPCTKWVDGELDDKGYELVYDDQGTPSKKGVRCSISLESEDSGITMHAVIETAKSKHPIVLIDDFETLALDAYESNPTTPKKQASYLKDVLSCRQIVAVGTMSRISDKNGSSLYVDFACVFLMECNPDIKPVNETPKLDEFKNEEPDPSLTPEQKIVAAIVQTCEINGMKDPAFIPVDKLRTIAEIGAEYDDNMVREFAKAAAAQMKK